MHMLQTHALTIFSVIVLILISVRRFLIVRIDTICVRFRFDPLSRAFSNRCVLDENAQGIRVDGRPKRIEMYVLVWTRP